MICECDVSKILEPVHGHCSYSLLHRAILIVFDSNLFCNMATLASRFIDVHCPFKIKRDAVKANGTAAYSDILTTGWTFFFLIADLLPDVSIFFVTAHINQKGDFLRLFASSV